MGGRADRGLEHLPSALLRRPVPGLVPARRERRRDGRRLAPRVRGPVARRPVDRRAGRVQRGPARQAGRVRRRPRHHGHLGDLVAHAGDSRQMGGRPGTVRLRLPDGPAPAGARDHPDLAVLDDRPLRARARSVAVASRRHLRMDPRPGPEEDGKVGRQRRHAARLPREVQRRRRALLGGIGPPRGGHDLQRGADEGRPAARHQDPERESFRVVPHGRHRDRDADPGTGLHGARCRHARPPRRGRRRGDRRSSTPTTTPGPSR